MLRLSQGAAGVDGQCLAEFESDLRNNLYKIWNRMSSGTYFPPPVRAVEIPKAAGGTRMAGVPAVADRVAHSLIHLGPPLTDAKRPGQSQVYRRPGDLPSSHRHEKASAKRAGAWPACRCRGMIVTVGPAGMSGSVTGNAADLDARGVVPRPALLGLLGGPARVIVVSASPGSGKTVPLRSWISQAGLTGRTAWVPAAAGGAVAGRAPGPGPVRGRVLRHRTDGGGLPAGRGAGPAARTGAAAASSAKVAGAGALMSGHRGGQHEGVVRPRDRGGLSGA